MYEYEVKVTDKNFKKEVLESKLPCLMDFWASWCQPCLHMTKPLQEIAKEYKDKLKICKGMSDDVIDAALKYSVLAIPTLILFAKGKEVDRIVGSTSKQDIIDKVNEYIDL